MKHEKIEELLVSFRESIPRLYWGLYQGLLAAGFDQPQAFTLLQTYVLSQNPYGIRPPSREDGPESDDPK